MPVAAARGLEAAVAAARRAMAAGRRPVVGWSFLTASLGEVRDELAAFRAALPPVVAGLTPSVELMFGLPGEAEEDREATRRMARRLAGLGARVAAHAFMPLPGTPWAGERAARIDGTTRRLLDRLASAGSARGPWRRQAAESLEGGDPVETD